MTSPPCSCPHSSPAAPWETFFDRTALPTLQTTVAATLLSFFDDETPDTSSTNPRSTFSAGKATHRSPECPNMKVWCVGSLTILKPPSTSILPSSLRSRIRLFQPRQGASLIPSWLEMSGRCSHLQSLRQGRRLARAGEKNRQVEPRRSERSHQQRLTAAYKEPTRHHRVATARTNQALCHLDLVPQAWRQERRLMS